jgi:Thioredoxin
MISALVVVLGMGVQAPARDGIDYASFYAQGITFAEFLSNAQALADEWRDTYTHATIDDQVLTRARALKGRWQLLIVADDSCHDSLNTVPYLAKLSEAVPDAISIRVVSSAVAQAVKDAHQTPDGRAATPTIVVLDARGEVKGVFIERPAALRQYIDEHGAGKYPHEIRDLRQRWYESDKGRHAVSEVLEIMEGS